jgi:large subunit ribosomal protein L28
MSKQVCQITGKGVVVGHKVSHSNIKTKKRFYPNLKDKRFYVPEEGKWINLRVSAAGMKHINKKGISACLKEAREKGYLK